MKEDRSPLVSFETALLAKKVGFDEFALCGDSYITEGEWEGDLISQHCIHIGPKTNSVMAPTLRTLQTWLREKKHVVVDPKPKSFSRGIITYKYGIYTSALCGNCVHIIEDSDTFGSVYYHAIEAGLNKALNLMLKNDIIYKK